MKKHSFMIKKTVSVIVAAIMVLSLTACEDDASILDISEEEKLSNSVEATSTSTQENVISDEVCMLDELPEYDSEEERFLAIFNDILADAFNTIYNEKVPANIELSGLLTDAKSFSDDQKSGIGFGFCDIDDDGITELIIVGKEKGESYSKLYAVGYYDCVGAFLAEDIREEERVFASKVEDNSIDFETVVMPFCEYEGSFGNIPKEEEEIPSIEKVTGELQFSTVDINGNAVTQDIILESKVILLNLWEPWCGPCVNEMPELQKLYDNYKDRGLLIIGAYQDYDEEAQWVVSDAGVMYPIVKVDSNLAKYEQSYVPATFVFDGNGNLLDSDPVAGAMNYSSWEAYVLQYLE